MPKTAFFLALACIIVAACGGSGEASRAVAKSPAMRMEATAYSAGGRTASGAKVREGMVAADPDTLPLGTRIRITDAGNYDGIYTVADTGRKVQGRKIDIYMPSPQEARQFGTRTVTVEALDTAGRPAGTADSTQPGR